MRFLSFRFCYRQKLENFPTNEKYFFNIKSVSRVLGCPVTFKSLETGEFLHCNADGKPFMSAVTGKKDRNGEPKDRQTWFCCHKDERAQDFKDQKFESSGQENSQDAEA